MEDRNKLFPVFLKLESLNTLLVGGGNVGLEKLTAILKSSPASTVTVVAGWIHPEIKIIAKSNINIRLVERNFHPVDLDGHEIAILATDDKTLHQQIKILARARRMLINVADTPELCDFYLGSIVTKGNIKIGISTNGKSPTIAKRLREFLEESIPDNTELLLQNMQKIRETIKGGFAEKVRVLNEITTSFLHKNVK